jgi:hypothetical protein
MFHGQDSAVGPRASRKIYDATLRAELSVEGERSLIIVSLCAKVVTRSLEKVRNNSATDERR